MGQPQQNIELTAFRWHLRQSNGCRSLLVLLERRMYGFGHVPQVSHRAVNRTVRKQSRGMQLPLHFSERNPLRFFSVGSYEQQRGLMAGCCEARPRAWWLPHREGEVGPRTRLVQRRIL